ncbi:MAG: RluA family pseudouridine synthase [Betaproteobacteria bacterium]
MELPDYIDDEAFMEEVLPVTTIQLEISKSYRGVRIDKCIADLIPQYSRSKIQQWILKGSISINKIPISSKYMIIGGEWLELDIPEEPQNNAFKPENIPLEVVYSDKEVGVINKPVGMVVHPAVGNWGGTMLNGILHHFPECSLVPRAGIVHRLDKDTSGLLVFSKTLESHTNLVRQLQERSMKRKYLALIWGEAPYEKTIDVAIGRDQRDRIKMGVTHVNNGKTAKTHIKKIESVSFHGKVISLIQCQLETGRTHQIRVHLESIGLPLINDPLYRQKVPQITNNKLKELMRDTGFESYGQFLHAMELGFLNPLHKTQIEFQIKPDDLFIKTLKNLGFSDVLTTLK